MVLVEIETMLMLLLRIIQLKNREKFRLTKSKNI